MISLAKPSHLSNMAPLEILFFVFTYMCTLALFQFFPYCSTYVCTFPKYIYSWLHWHFHVCVTAVGSLCSNYRFSEDLFWRWKFIDNSQLLCQTFSIHCLKFSSHTRSILCLYTLKKKLPKYTEVQDHMRSTWDLSFSESKFPLISEL